MKNASLFLVLLFSLSFAGEFLCGGVGGIPCTTDCPGQWSESMHDYVACECPPEGCICYCPVGGGTPQTGTGTTNPDLVEEATYPACQEEVSGSCPECGMIQTIDGKMAVRRDGEWCTAYNGLSLKPGDWVVVPQGSRVRVMLFDGGQMDVNENSGFIFEGMDVRSPDFWDITTESFYGAVHYLIFSTDRVEQFDVRINGAHHGIRGTEFVVEATDEYQRLRVLDGSVEFWKEGSDARVLVNEGESSVLYSGSSAPNTPQEFNVAGESRWWNSLEGGSCCGTAFILMIVPLLAVVFRSN